MKARMHRHYVAAAAALSAGLLLVQPAWADPADLAPRLVPTEMMADHLVMLARRVLIGDGEAKPSQITRARILFDQALLLTPADTELLLLRAELARRLGDRATYLSLLHRYCALQPRDDAAHLDLIFASVEHLQTLKERAAAIEAFLGQTPAANLSSPLRSRLHAFLAQAAREVGDMRLTGHHLKQAIELDGANKQAAMIVYELAETRGEGTAARGAALLAVVQADPADPVWRLAMADLLLSQGAYAAASEQYEAAMRLGGLFSAEQVHAWALALAADNQIDAALARLAVAETPSGTPGEGSLPVDLELLRLAILHHAGLTGRAETAYHRLVTVLDAAVAAGDANATRHRDWIAAMFSPQLPDPRDSVVLAMEQRAAQHPLANRALGWYYLRRGEHLHAAQVLRETAERDELARYGLARATQGQQKQIDRAGLMAIHRRHAGTLAGLFAARDLAKAAVTAPPSDEVAAMLAAMGRWRGSLRMPDLMDRRWTLLQLEIEPQQYQYLDPITARIRLRNAFGRPLALGPGQTLPTTLLIFTAARFEGRAIGHTPPTVVDMRRRLTLAPQEALEVQVRLDRAAMGSILAFSPSERISFSVTAMLDPQVTTGGDFISRPLGAMDAKHLIERRGMAPTQPNIEQWLGELDRPGDGGEYLRTLARLSMLAFRLADGDQAMAFKQRITSRIDRAFPDLDRLGQAWVLGFTPAGGESERLLPNLHNLAQGSAEPLVRLMYLTEHVGDPKSPHLESALRHDHPVIREYATALRESLEQTTPMMRADR